MYQSLFERFSLEGGEAGVEGSQFPQGHNLVAHGGAGVLAGLGVAVDIVLALPGLMERNLQSRYTSTHWNNSLEQFLNS